VTIEAEALATNFVY